MVRYRISAYRRARERCDTEESNQIGCEGAAGNEPCSWVHQCSPTRSGFGISMVVLTKENHTVDWAAPIGPTSYEQGPEVVSQNQVASVSPQQT